MNWSATQMGEVERRLSSDYVQRTKERDLSIDERNLMEEKLLRAEDSLEPLRNALRVIANGMTDGFPLAAAHAQRVAQDAIGVPFAERTKRHED